MMPTKKLFLLDAMALIYRAYFALNRNPRISSKGVNTSAILGFTNTLYDILSHESPSHIGVAFDSFAPTVRHEAYADYKATRESIPEDIAASLPWIRQIIDAFNIPILEMIGFEADDIIGTLAKKAEKDGFQVFMMTPDKDFGQLVSENIKIYKPARSGNDAEILGVEEICKKYGIQRPEQLIDILGLWGDASDNIPGIPGIGEKTAAKLISKYGSVEALIENSSELTGKQKENIEKFKDQGIMSKELATILLDVPVPWDEEDLTYTGPDIQKLKELFDELEFRTLAKRLFSNMQEARPSKIVSKEIQGSLFDDKGEVMLDNKETFNPENVKYIAVETDEQRKALVKELTDSAQFCFDTETTSLDAINAELVGISFAITPGEAWFVHCPEERELTQQIVEIFKPLFENQTIGKIGQNIKYDMEVLLNYGVEVVGELYDTMIAHYLLQPDMRHNMDILAENYLNYHPVSIETLIGKKGKSQRSMRTVERSKLKDYACEDADITLRLWHIFKEELEQHQLMELFTSIEMPLVRVLCEMERNGVKLDIKALNEYSSLLTDEILSIKKEIFEYAGTEFNISSPKQLGEILFERLKISDKPKRTKTKQYSTGEDVLLKLKDNHPIVEAILTYRSLTKLKSTYVDALPALINSKTGMVHTSYNQTVAATGRLSSNNPNLQNIPIRTSKGREIRKAFIPRAPDNVMMAADYSQIELRIIAHLSGDEVMKKAFSDGQDIHTATASKVFDVPLDAVTEDMRRKAKMVNFGIAYGISAFGLSERLNISRGEAADIIEAYFRQYPEIKRYMDRTIQQARKNGYVETIKQRRRYLRDINSSNNTVKQFAERNAINAPIQGSSADMIKIAMISIYREMKRQKMKSKMIMQVHDELVFDVVHDELEKVKKITMEGMQNAIPLSVPIKVDIKTGKNWLEAH